jgi:hypothetical protein
LDRKGQLAVPFPTEKKGTEKEHEKKQVGRRELG